ncbi:unnamed protein product [Adineta steineri]|uniref:Uncharacterized protein n=1 Tax=Adineta steineri TaxID=433720 RepID=A0A813NQ75_9BILA|nr:unnamed protein product [Adineta steineri]CAF3879193.1 unnamed protein product [Adineta steineri]
MASNHVEEDSDEDEKKTNTDIGSYRRTKLKLAMIRGNILRDATPNYAKLDGAGLSDRDVPAIIQQTLRDKSFTILNLRKNRITSIGIGLLIQELKTNTTLRNLDISRNPIEDEGARYLAELFTSPNQTLLGLSMGDAGITDQGIKHLTDALITNRTHIYSIYLCSNKLITDASIDAFINVIKTNSKFSFHLGGCSLSKKGAEHLESTVKELGGSMVTYS